MDGFCSIVTFSPGELGEVIEKVEETSSVTQEQTKKEPEKMETDNDLRLELEETQTQPEQQQQQSTSIQSSVEATSAASSDGKKRAPLVTLISGAANIQQGGATPEKPKGRRIELITLSSPKTKS